MICKLDLFYPQLITVHGEVDDNFRQPLVYGLLCDKSIQTYQRFLVALNIICDGRFRPTTWVVDYEYAFLRALQIVYGDIHIIGCFFHFAQWCVLPLPFLIQK